MTTHADEEGWWWFECSVCGYRQGPFPDRNSAEEENYEHDC